MKLIIVFSAFFAIFSCFSQIGFTSAEPTLGLEGLVGGLPIVGGLLGGLGGAGGGLPLVGGLLGGGGGGGLVGVEPGTSQTNADDIALQGIGNSVTKGVELKGNLNVLPNGLL